MRPVHVLIKKEFPQFIVVGVDNKNRLVYVNANDVPAGKKVVGPNEIKLSTETWSVTKDINEAVLWLNICIDNELMFDPQVMELYPKKANVDHLLRKYDEVDEFVETLSDDQKEYLKTKV